jgi:putative flippase GtrA
VNLYKKFKQFEVIKILKYLVIGGITFVLYEFFLWIFFSRLGFTHLLSITISYFLAILFHFMANKKITFKVRNNTNQKEVIYYLLIAGVNYIIQLLINYTLINLFGLNIYVSALVGICCTVILGFLSLNFWVFKPKNILK